VTSLVHRNAGLRFAVSETGEGRPMIFQHGLCGDASQVADVFPAVVPRLSAVDMDSRKPGRQRTSLFQHLPRTLHR
jgi:hypothetical protein